MAKNKNTMINLICSMVLLATNVVISFWLSPFIVENVGVEANGFVNLASNFVTYAQLIVSALNSMSSRFITYEYIRGDYKRANMYYNSVFWGNLVIVGVLIIPAIFLIARFETLFDVPIEILTDVKILFSIIFLNFFITTAAPNWNNSTFITNRLDRRYIPDTIITIIRFVFLIVVLNFISTKVYVVGLATLVVTILTLATAFYNQKTLTPDLKIGLKPGSIICSKKAVKELVSSGIWNSISSVGNILLSGLDLLICNTFIGATAMGVLSLSKIIPNYILQLSVSIRNAFSPELVINYAKGDKEAIYDDLNRAMKITSIILTIPIAVVVVFGERFFALWVPSQDAVLLNILSVLSIALYMFTSGTQILFNVFTTVNKVRLNSIIMILSGFISALLTVLIIIFTDYDIYAVAGVSTVVNLVRNMVWTLPATAKYLGFKWNIFYKQVITTVFCSILLIGIGFLIKGILPSGTWLYLILSAGILGIIGLLVNAFIILNKQERKILLDMILTKLHIKKGNRNA